MLPELPGAVHLRFPSQILIKNNGKMLPAPPWAVSFRFLYLMLINNVRKCSQTLLGCFLHIPLLNPITNKWKIPPEPPKQCPSELLIKSFPKTFKNTPSPSCAVSIRLPHYILIKYNGICSQSLLGRFPSDFVCKPFIKSDRKGFQSLLASSSIIS